jgi:hypothetical protein
MEKQLIEEISDGVATLTFIGLIGSTLFRHRLWKACSKRCPDWRRMPPSE